MIKACNINIKAHDCDSDPLLTVERDCILLTVAESTLKLNRNQVLRLQNKNQITIQRYKQKIKVYIRHDL